MKRNLNGERVTKATAKARKRVMGLSNFIPKGERRLWGLNTNFVMITYRKLFEVEFTKLVPERERERERESD
jgi:hypothetical protein